MMGRCARPWKCRAAFVRLALVAASLLQGCAEGERPASSSQPSGVTWNPSSTFRMDSTARALNDSLPGEEPTLVLSTLWPDRPVPLGAGQVISVVLQDGGQPVRGVDVRAAVISREGRSDLRLRDDGIAPDAVARDGVYAAQSEPFRKDGPRLVDVAALREGPPGTFTVLAQAKEYITVVRSRSRLNGRYRDFGRDTDGDGFFDELVLQVGFAATDPGRYEVFAELEDRAGRLQTARGAKRVVLPGDQTIELAFDGETIFERGEGGPYSITRVMLSEDGWSGMTPIDRRLRDHRTGAYRFAQFERDPVRISGTARADLVDRDGDGEPDALDVGVLVGIDIAGDYSWQATLEDTVDHGSVTGHGSGHLEPGDRWLVVRYKGSSLRPLASAGSYRVTEFWVLGDTPAVTAAGIDVPGDYPSDRFDVVRGP